MQPRSSPSPSLSLFIPNLKPNDKTPSPSISIFNFLERLQISSLFFTRIIQLRFPSYNCHCRVPQSSFKVHAQPDFKSANISPINTLNSIDIPIDSPSAISCTISNGTIHSAQSHLLPHQIHPTPTSPCLESSINLSTRSSHLTAEVEPPEEEEAAAHNALLHEALSDQLQDQSEESRRALSQRAEFQLDQQEVTARFLSAIW